MRPGWFVLSGLALLSACGSAPARVKAPPEVASRDLQTLAPHARERVIQDHDGLSTDKELNRYVQQVGDRVTREIQRIFPFDSPYRFWVVNRSGAHCFPGLAGDIFVSRGLILFCNSEDDLAALLAHEALKVALKYTRRNLTLKLPRGGAVSDAAQDVRTGRPFTGEPWRTGRTWRTFARVAQVIKKLRYTVDQEEEADRHTLRILVHTNYNPLALSRIYRRFLKREIDSGNYSSVHRISEARCGVAERRIREQFKATEGRRFETERFDRGTRNVEDLRRAYAFLEGGYAALRRGKVRDALRNFEKAAELNTGPIFMLGRARGHLNARQFEAAIQDASKGIYYTHSIEALFLVRARAHEGRSEYPGAADNLRQALVLVKRPSTYGMLGTALERQARYIPARRAFVNCLELLGYSHTVPPPSDAPRLARTAYERLQVMRRK